MNDRFWQFTCSYRPVWGIALALNTLFLVLILLSIPFIRVPSPTFYVTVLTVLMVLPMFVFSVYVLRRCRIREEEL